MKDMKVLSPLHQVALAAIYMFKSIIKDVALVV